MYIQDGKAKLIQLPSAKAEGLGSKDPRVRGAK